MVLDPHVHAWAAPTYDHPWVNELHAGIVEEFSVGTTYPTERLLADMDAIGVDEAVVVGYPIYDWTDNAYAVAAAREHDRLSAVVMLDAYAADAPTQLREYMASPGVVGVRFGLQFAPEHDAMWNGFDPEAAWFPEVIEHDRLWTAAVETDAAVQLFVHHGQLDQVWPLLERYPDLTVLIDHWAHADPTDPPGEGSFAALERLAAYDGVAIKVSETPFVADEPFPYPDVHDHLRWLLETFGRERVIWGSDFPNVSHPEYGDTTYEHALTWLTAVDGLSATDREWLTGRAFREHVAL